MRAENNVVDEIPSHACECTIGEMKPESSAEQPESVDFYIGFNATRSVIIFLSPGLTKCMKPARDTLITTPWKTLFNTCRAVMLWSAKRVSMTVSDFLGICS